MHDFDGGWDLRGPWGMGPLWWLCYCDEAGHNGFVLRNLVGTLDVPLLNNLVGSPGIFFKREKQKVSLSN